MSALLVGGASTFVSCKDYDGDQAAVQNAELAKLQDVVKTNKEKLDEAIAGKQDKLSDAILADLAKLNETIGKANSADEWVKANSELNRLTASVTALATLAQDQATLSKLAAMTETWGQDFSNVVLRDELAAYLTKEELQQAWPSIQAMFEKKEDMHKDVEAIIDSITAANAENFTTYAGLVAAFDKVPAKLQEIDAQLTKLLAWNENIQYTLDNLVTGVNVDMVVNPFFGTLNTPFGIKSTTLVGFVGGEIEKKNFNGVNVGGLATSLDGGKVYLTVNPNDIDATGLTFALVGRDGNEAPGYKLGALTKDYTKVTTVPTRAAVNGYVADAGILDGRAAQVTVPTEDLKNVAKNVLGKLRGQEALDITNAVRTIYSTFANAIPQYYALQAEYNTKDAKGNIVKKAYTSDYNIAAVTVKPLAYTTNIGVVGEKVNIPQIPSLQQWLNANITNISYSPIDPNSIEDVTVHIENAKNVEVKYEGQNPNGTVTFTPNSGTGDITMDFSKISVTGETLDVTVELDDLRDVVEKLNAQVENMVGDVNKLFDKAESLAGRFDNIASKVNTVISAANKFIDNANQYLQPIMLGVANDGAFRLSEVKEIPTVVKANGENAIILAPTSYTLELLAPAYKKSVKVNDTELNGEDLDGATKTIAATLKAGKNTIEYSVMDFYGNVVDKKYYIEVK